MRDRAGDAGRRAPGGQHGAGGDDPSTGSGQAYRRYDTQLILFLLKQRLHNRYDHDTRVPQPGSPVFEKVRAMIEAERPDPDEIIASIDAKLDRMRERWLARQAAEGGSQDRVPD